MPRQSCFRIGFPSFVLGFLVWVPSSQGFEATRLDALLQQAREYESRAEWDKACDLYESALRLDRSLVGVKDQYQHCLRRYWQARRHRDLGFRKEVLSLDYGQALRLYGIMRDTLLENGLDKKKADPGKLFLKGLEEFDAALADPFFCAQFLITASPEHILKFRQHMLKTWSGGGTLTKTQALKRLREVALAAQNDLKLSCTVTILEFTCGSCYALDEYTLYLTPTQLRDLCDSLRGGTESSPSVLSQWREMDQVGYISINGFKESTPQELDDAITALLMKDMKALILDLRGNDGGLFEVAIDVAQRFIASGIIASTENIDPSYSKVYEARNPGALAIPMVVLIDGDTASAAEVLAGALKDHKRARLVGQTTFGKGCTQCLLRFPDAPGAVPTGGMRLTVARFFSPEGHSYAGRGVSPHFMVGRSAPGGPMMPGGDDSQMNAALLEVNRLLTMR